MAGGTARPGSRYRSVTALDWATRQRTGKATANHLLLVMAGLVSDKPMLGEFGREWPAMHCWAGIDRLAELTEQNRKTVMAGIQMLLKAGLISLAGMQGQTNRQAVYELHINGPENGTIEQGVMVPSLPANDPENGFVPIKEFKEGKERRECAPRALVSKAKGKTADQGMPFAAWLQSIPDDHKASPQLI